jgi:hypothetical protein
LAKQPLQTYSLRPATPGRQWRPGFLPDVFGLFIRGKADGQARRLVGGDPVLLEVKGQTGLDNDRLLTLFKHFKTGVNLAYPKKLADVGDGRVQ